MRTTYKFNGRKNREGEFVLQCFVNGCRYKDGDYYTADREDALATLNDLQSRLQKNPDQAPEGGVH